MLYAHQRDDAKQEVAFFVSQLDKLVLSIDQLTEQKIRLVAYTQLIFTALTLLLLLVKVTLSVNLQAQFIKVNLL